MGTEKIQQLIQQLAGEPKPSKRPPPMRDQLDRFVAGLNQSEPTVFPDEFDVLGEVCKLIDGETDDQVAWRQVSDIESTDVFDQPPEFDQLHQAVGYSILQSTVAYINIKSEEVATGVLVEFDGRMFLATTAHSIPARPSGKLSFVGNASTRIDENIAPILGHGKDPDDEQRDVAFVELDPVFVHKRVEKAAISLSRIYPCRSGREKFWTLVGGYPGKEGRDVKQPSNRVPTKLFTLQCWGNTILTPDRWDVLEEESQKGTLYLLLKVGNRKRIAKGDIVLIA